ncbi:MAG: four helix bundle suffix domain-containing protein [Candidatus Shapirobacteria bacterium]
MTEAGYKYLKTYQLSVVIYDLTVEFCRLFLGGFDFRRLREQMIQAARSTKQNIAEGYLEKSLKSYIKLLGVAVASLEELLEDYEDFLRQRKLGIWDKNDSRVRELRVFRGFWGLGKTPKSPNTPSLLPSDPEKAANMLLTVGHQASFLLARQIKVLEEKFVKEGGYTEKLFQKRLKYKIGEQK